MIKEFCTPEQCYTLCFMYICLTDPNHMESLSKLSEYVSAISQEMLLKGINTLRPRQDRRHFTDDIFTCDLFNENHFILITFSLKYFRKGPVDNNPALVQIMAWRDEATSHYLNQWWLVYWRIYVSLGFNELTHKMSLKNTFARLLPYLPWGSVLIWWAIDPYGCWRQSLWQHIQRWEGSHLDKLSILVPVAVCWASSGNELNNIQADLEIDDSLWNCPQISVTGHYWL